MNENLIAAYVSNFDTACLAKKQANNEMFEAAMKTSLFLTLALTVSEHTEAMKRIVSGFNQN